MSGSGIVNSDRGSSMAALELLADPAKLKAKLAQFQKAEESARAVIEQAGPAHEILKIREAIAKDQAHVRMMVDETELLVRAKIREAEDRAAGMTTAARPLHDARNEASVILARAESERQQVMAERAEGALALQQTQILRGTLERELAGQRAKSQALDDSALAYQESRARLEAAREKIVESLR